jgi:hypothetical protein
MHYLSTKKKKNWADWTRNQIFKTYNGGGLTKKQQILFDENIILPNSLAKYWR